MENFLCGELAVFVTGSALICRAAASVALHAKIHFESGFMNPASCGGQLCMARRARIAVVGMGKNDIRRNSVHSHPLHLHGERLSGMTALASGRGW